MAIKRDDLLRFLIFVIVIVTVILIIPHKEKWQGFYYPDGCLVCEDQYIYSPVYSTKENCLNWATTLRAERNNPADLFECGKNCKDKDGFQVCEETIDE